MSSPTHKTYGKISGMGFKFNYPVKGAVYDIEGQRFVVMPTTTLLTDEDLKNEFVTQVQFGHRWFEGKWRDIKEIIDPYLNDK